MDILLHERILGFISYLFTLNLWVFSGYLILFIRIFIILIFLVISLLLLLMSTALSTRTLFIVHFEVLLLSILSSILQSSSIEHSYALITVVKMILWSLRCDRLIFSFLVKLLHSLRRFHMKDSFYRSSLLLRHWRIALFLLWQLGFEKLEDFLLFRCLSFLCWKYHWVQNLILLIFSWELLWFY